MLDPITMKLLGNLKMSAKKSGTNIDLTKMADDSNYAELTLKALSNSDDPELALIVIKLMNHFGMLDLTMDLSKAQSSYTDEM